MSIGQCQLIENYAKSVCIGMYYNLKLYNFYKLYHRKMKILIIFRYFQIFLDRLDYNKISVYM